MTVDAKARGLSITEPLALQDLPDEGLEFRDALPEDWLAPLVKQAHGLEFIPSGDGTAHLSVEPAGPVDSEPPIRIHGTLQAQVRTECVRCLHEVTQRLEAVVEMTLFSREAADTPEGLDEGTYEGRRLPLPDVIAESLVLELDMNPVCEDRQACDDRTARMLQEANRPAREAITQPTVDPRWAALADLDVE